jgi:predicted secreted protein
MRYFPFDFPSCLMARVTFRRSLARTAAFVAALALLPSFSHAQTMATRAEPTGILSLTADATADVPQDTVRITLALEAENPDAAKLAQQLNQTAEAVIREAKANNRLDVRSGGYSIYPSNDNKSGRMVSWRGRIETVIESKDFAAAGELAGRVGARMPVANVQFFLSREAREKEEKRLTETAIKTFQEKAATAAKAFGYGSYTVREVSVNAGHQFMPHQSARADVAMMSRSSAQVPLEGGKSQVTVNVSGAVQMVK